MMRLGIWVLLVIFGGMAVCGGVQAQVVADSLVVTDVTPKQFCVVWTTSEPASAWLHVFSDPDGATPALEAVVKSDSAEHPPAEDIGVMKARAVGLDADKEYFFQTVTTTKKDNAVYYSPIQRVRTERASVIVRNDVLVQKVTIGESGPAPGMLVIAHVEDASYPVSGWVGDGVAEHYASINTNNFYNKDTHINLELQGGELLNLKVIGGSLGSAETQEIIPDESGGMQKLSRAVSMAGSGQQSSSTAPSAGGGGCFENTKYSRQKTE
jgi:hypothetical protein